MELVCKKPVIIIDGAHNEAGLEKLKNYLKKEYNNKYDLVFGCLKNRDFEKLATIIKSGYNNYWIQFDGGCRTTSPDVYKQVKLNLGGEIVSLDNKFKDKAMNQNNKRPLIVCGSFYLCDQFHKTFL